LYHLIGFAALYHLIVIIAQLNLPIQKLGQKLETTGREYKLVVHIFAVEQHDSNMVKLPLLEL
jgi:hypothetical protein